MASLSEIELPHGTIPTQMFGNVNLQNAVMYINENFAEVKSGVNAAISATNDALDEKADADHDHDEDYAALSHTHAQSEITGLQSALDGKAELNHEHSQYLSSLPTHYHDVSGISGLAEQLQTKAEATHIHTISQIEDLATQLGNKASGAYVDQKVASIGDSLAPLIEKEVDSEITTRAADVGTTQTSMGSFPNDVEQTGETLWTAGGTNGADVLLVFKGQANAQEGYELFTCKLTISKLGTITKIEAVEDGGITILGGL